MGLLSRLASRLGRDATLPMRIADQDIDMIFRTKRGLTDVSWRWRGETGTTKRKGIGAHDQRRIFDQMAAAVANEIAARPPQPYLVQGFTGGHVRRYERDLMSRLPGTGYSVSKDENEFLLTPGLQAYMNYIAPRALGTGSLGGAMWAEGQDGR